MKTNSPEAGFSIIDVMIAIVILTIGILGTLSALTTSVILNRSQQQQLQARQYAASTMESIMAIKETAANNTVLGTAGKQLSWDNIGNVGTNSVNGVPQGIFLIGANDIKNGAGLDQVYGTADDAGAGPDQIFGTADDDNSVVPNFQRTIVITDICDPARPSPAPVCPAGSTGTSPVMFRQVTVTITYFVNQLQRQETLTTVLANY